MLPIDRYLSGWMTGFLTGIIIAGLIWAVVFLIYQVKNHRTHISPMRTNDRWLDPTPHISATGANEEAPHI